jgi:cysteine desulfurase
MPSIYLDYAATTPCDPRAIKAMTPYFFDSFGNASSPHAFGRRARKAIEAARERVASFIGAQPAEIVFTSGTTEGNNQVIFGVARSLAQKGKHIIISAIDHHSVLMPARELAQSGYEISYIVPDRNGTISPQSIASVIRADTVLVAVAHANNEIGTIQPIEEIGLITRGRGVYFLVDAAQTIGHLPVNVVQMNCDFCTFSAHKFYGPQGVGGLYVRKGTECTAFVLGGDQERGRRAGTQNVAGVVGMDCALDLCRQHMAEDFQAQRAWQKTIITSVQESVPGTTLNGHPTQRLPNNVHFSFEMIDGEELVAALDLSGVACSVGSACTSGQLEPSHVLKALGASDRRALGSLRVTTGRWTESGHIEYFLGQLKIKIEQLKAKR